jgi:hypothetical protein
MTVFLRAKADLFEKKAIRNSYRKGSILRDQSVLHAISSHGTTNPKNMGR